MSTQNPTPDYAGLSKQEVAERLKNPTPDATATPRMDDDEARLRAEWLHNHGAPKDWLVFTESEVAALKGELMAVKELSDNRASAIKWAQGELTAAKAECENYKRCVNNAHEAIDASGIIMPRDKSHQGLTPRVKSIIARAERAEASACEAVADNAQLRAEVERLKAADSFSKRELARGNEIIDGLRQERDQLRARVADLELALRLAGAESHKVRELAARDGKGAT